MNTPVPHWVADRHKLKTSLDNLLSNAVNYTPEGAILMWYGGAGCYLTVT